MGHGFWPHEVLRDAIIFASMLSVLLFYAWLIPPPLHGAADPYAQAGFVFPDLCGDDCTTFAPQHSVDQLLAHVLH